jgi:hypothetical protein
MALSNPIKLTNIQTELRARIADPMRDLIEYASDNEPRADVPDTLYGGELSGPDNPDLTVPNTLIYGTDIHNMCVTTADAMKKIRKITLNRKISATGTGVSTTSEVVKDAWFFWNAVTEPTYDANPLGSGTEIDDTEMTNHMDSFYSDLVAAAATISHTYTVCHSDCHNDCHNSRGRR